MPMSADEVLTAVPSADALRQAEILAIRQLSDNVAILGRNVEKLELRTGEVRDKVIQLEAQELKGTILQVKADVMEAVKGVREEHERRIADVCRDVERVESEAAKEIKRVEAAATAETKRIEGEGVKNALALARLRGTILPLASLGSAVLAAILSVIVDLLIKGHVGP